jgi:hypothetical protein
MSRKRKVLSARARFSPQSRKGRIVDSDMLSLGVLHDAGYKQTA